MIHLALSIAAFLFLCCVGTFIFKIIEVILEEFLREILVLLGIAATIMVFIYMSVK